MTRSAPSIQIRRYGRSDFEKFCEESARGEDLFVGSETIGDIAVHCKYRWKKSQWGVLGREENPAGIVYMDITFDQPAGCSLERANVFITLSEDDSTYALDKRRARASSKSKSRRKLDRDYTVQITDHWGPKHLTGTRTTLSETKSQKLVPTFGAMGFEIGGLGHENSTTRDSTGHWAFRGNTGPPINGSGLRTLKWELSENRLDPGQIQKQEYHTAFAFEHSSRPVYMRVEIDGKLRSRGRKLAYDFVKFSSNLANQDNSTLTLMNFGSPASKRNLDELAKGLNMAMEMENCQQTPLEVPGPTQATFTGRQSSESLGQRDGSCLTAEEEQILAALEAKKARGERLLEETQAGYPASGQTETDAIVSESRGDGFLEALQAQLDSAPHPLDQDTMQNSVSSLAPSNATTETLVNNDPLCTPGINATNKNLLAVPGIALLSFLEFISTIIRWFGSLPQDRQELLASRAKVGGAFLASKQLPPLQSPEPRNRAPKHDVLGSRHVLEAERWRATR